MYLYALFKVKRLWGLFTIKTALVMQLTSIILLAACLQVSAFAHAQTVSISGNNLSLPKVFKKIRQQTGYNFIYTNEELQKTNPVSIHVNNAPLKEVLEQCLISQPVDYMINDKIIIIKPKNSIPDASLLSLIKISGRVTDSATHAPLAGVTIQVKGSTIGTMTDNNGNFNLEAPDNAMLIVSYLGYSNKEIHVNGRTEINIQLSASSTALNQLVVIGYGTQKKSEITGAVDQIKGSVFTRRPFSNILQGLQGNTPGVTIMDGGGAPGSEGATINIRGISTLSSTSPLILVDGIEQNISDINPDDIASVTILKDASATAIYGSRASNGVVLITTKSSEAGKLRVTFNTYYAIQKSLTHPLPISAPDYFALQNVAYENAGSGQKYTPEYISNYLDSMKSDPLAFPEPVPDWYAAVLQSAPQFNGALSISGGSSTANTRLSLRYNDQDGIIDNFSNKIREVRLSNNFKLYNRIHISTDLDYRYNHQLTPISQYDVFDYLLQGTLWAVPRYPNGTYGVSPAGQSPLVNDEILGTTNNYGNLFVGNVKADLEILKGLKISTQIGVTSNSVSSKSYQNAFTIYSYFDPTKVLRNVPNNKLTEVRSSEVQYTINNLLTYSHSFGPHSINALLGYSQIGETTNNISAYRQNFYNNQIQQLNAGADNTTKDNSGDGSTMGLRSYFGRLNYNYKDKYLLQANGRYDGSSHFSTLQQYAFFPSFSGGWIISNENFWGNLSRVVNYLKLRGSWGFTGNQAIPAYEFYPAMAVLSYSFSGAPAQGYLQNTLVNQNLTWETTRQTDIGLNAQFLADKIGVTADYYYKHTSGILLQLPIPSMIGENPSYQNAGVVGDGGWEFQASYSDHSRNFKYTLSANFNISHNKVISLAGTGPYIYGSATSDAPMYIVRVGDPVYGQWGYKTDGIFQTQEEIDKSAVIGPNTQPGDLKYVDLNGDGKITPADMTYLGPSFPVYTYGMTADFQYKGFELNLLFQGAADVYTRISGAMAEEGINEGFVDAIYANNYWTPQNTSAYFPRPIKHNFRNVYPSQNNLWNTSYLRLKNIQLIYHLPESLLQKIRISNASIYVSSTNLLTFSRFYHLWHIDPEQPEMPLVQGNLDLSGRANNYPQLQVNTIGLRLEF